MTLRNVYLPALLSMGLLTGACAHGKQTIDEGASSETATVQVANHNWSDMNIYIVRGTDRRRLGTVNSNTVSTFTLPGSVLLGGEDIRLLADPIGSKRTYLSPPLVIAPGQRVEWRLENNIGLSSAMVRG